MMQTMQNQQTIPKIKHREYRTLSHALMPTIEAQKRIDSNYYVEGYATTFERYLLWEFGEVKFYEEISRNALDGADLSDIILQYDHHGKVFARTRNNTLGIEVDSKGLFVYADLSSSTPSKELYEEISAGLIDRMSWAFTVEDIKREEIDDKTILYRVERIKKVYDVSAVSIPANDGTEIYSRSAYLDFAPREIEASELLQQRLFIPHPFVKTNFSIF